MKRYIKSISPYIVLSLLVLWCGSRWICLNKLNEDKAAIFDEQITVAYPAIKEISNTYYSYFSNIERIAEYAHLAGSDYLEVFESEYNSYLNYTGWKFFEVERLARVMIGSFLYSDLVYAPKLRTKESRAFRLIMNVTLDTHNYRDLDYDEVIQLCHKNKSWLLESNDILYKYNTKNQFDNNSWKELKQKSIYNINHEYKRNRNRPFIWNLI